MKLLLNEMWSAEIARQLRRRKVDAVAATELPNRYRGVPDELVFARAREDGRIVVTDNIPDYLMLVRNADSRGESHAGVILVPRRSFDRARPGVVGEVVRALATMARRREIEPGGVQFLRRAPR